jgi:hypothetical protein
MSLWAKTQPAVAGNPHNVWLWAKKLATIHKIKAMWPLGIKPDIKTKAKAM